MELFETVAAVELAFLVNSGLGFGFLLGLGQMGVWLFWPTRVLLPLAGAVVGYATNYIAITMVFEPIEPVPLPGTTYELQGLFEKRQPEVSDAFAEFLQRRVLTPKRLLAELVDGERKDAFRALLRRELPFILPDNVLDAAINGIRDVADRPDRHASVHEYIKTALRVEDDLSTKLRALPSVQFEDLLHPVFQEDEFTLILVGGILGAAAGVAQLALGAAAVAAAAL